MLDEEPRENCSERRLEYGERARIPSANPPPDDSERAGLWW